MVFCVPWEIPVHVHSWIISISVAKWLCIPSDADKCLTLRAAGQQQPEGENWAACRPGRSSLCFPALLSEFRISEPPVWYLNFLIL